jgi:hypothetical protein
MELIGQTKAVDHLAVVERSGRVAISYAWIWQSPIRIDLRHHSSSVYFVHLAYKDQPVRFTNWYWTSCITLALALGCAESSAPPPDVRKVGPALNRLGETRPEPPYLDGQAVDSSIRDSTPAERQAAARQRRRESDLQRKQQSTGGYEPGKGGTLKLSSQDSAQKATANRRPKEKKEYLPHLPGKSDAWELRKQDSIRKAQQK